MSTDDLAADIATIIAGPVADLLDRTPTIVDLVPFLAAKPSYRFPKVRRYLVETGYDLPLTW